MLLHTPIVYGVEISGGEPERGWLTWGGHHGDRRPHVEDPEEDPPFGDELVEGPLERVPAAPAPADRHRHRADGGGLHFPHLAGGLLDLHLLACLSSP